MGVCIGSTPMSKSPIQQLATTRPASPSAGTFADTPAGTSRDRIRPSRGSIGAQPLGAQRVGRGTLRGIMAGVANEGLPLGSGSPVSYHRGV